MARILRLGKHHRKHKTPNTIKTILFGQQVFSVEVVNVEFMNCGTLRAENTRQHIFVSFGQKILNQRRINVELMNCDTLSVPKNGLAPKRNENQMDDGSGRWQVLEKEMCRRQRRGARLRVEPAPAGKSAEGGAA